MKIMQLEDMLTDLRVEARISPNVAHGAHLQAGHVALLRRTQEELYNAHDWPLLNVSLDVPVTAGDRYKTYPDGIAFEGISQAYVKGSDGDWDLLTYGVDVAQLNHKDSAADERDDPIRRWNHYLSTLGETVHQNMFEVWPIPETDTTIRFTGKRALFPLTDAATHSSTLDGPLIVLHAAAEILAGQKAEDAQVKMAKAQQRLEFLKRRQTGPDNRRMNMAATGQRRALRRGIDYI